MNHDREAGFPYVDETFRVALDELREQIAAQAVWITDEELVGSLQYALTFLTADDRLEAEVPDDLRLPGRTLQATRWMDRLLEKHVKESQEVVEPLANTDRFDSVHRSYLEDRAEFEEDYDKWWEQKKERLQQENQEKWARKMAALERASHAQQ